MIDHIGYKFKLYPSPSQIRKINQYFGYVRFVYNLGINIVDEYYYTSKNNDDVQYKTMSFYNLSKCLTNLKNTDNTLSWMNKYDATCAKIVLKDVINGYKRFYNGQCNKPVYKSKKNYWQSFPVRKERMSILGEYLYLPGFEEPILVKNIPNKLQGFGNKETMKVAPYNRKPIFRDYEYVNYCNPRVTYNGVDYYISFTIKIDDYHKPSSCDKFIDNDIWNHKHYSDIIGLDWGARHSNWYIASNGMKLERPDQTTLDKRIQGYERKLSRQKRINDKTIERTNQYTKNELKTLRRWNKLTKKHTNQRLYRLHGFVNNIIEIKPEAIVLEDISSKELISATKNAKLNKSINDSIPYMSRIIFTYKCEANGIKVIIADKEFKSTQLCSNCGHEQKMGSKRIYKCPLCGIKIDRDLNSSYNLRNYGYNLLHQEDLVYDVV